MKSPVTIVYPCKLVNTDTIVFKLIIIIIIILIRLVCSLATLAGPRLTVDQQSPTNCLEEVIESATFHPLFYPNSHLAELQPQAAEPDFHCKSLVGQFVTGHQHMPPVLHLCEMNRSVLVSPFAIARRSPPVG